MPEATCSLVRRALGRAIHLPVCRRPSDRHRLLTGTSLALLLTCAPAMPQQPKAPASSKSSLLASGIERMTGTDASSQIQYVQLNLKGTLFAVKGAPDLPQPDPPPILIAQCSLRPDGKYFFDLFAIFGGPAKIDFLPPWKPSSSHDLFAPRTEKVTLTMEFLGYTHVKPLRRQWEVPVQAPSLLHYNPPSGNSSNMEEAAYFLRFLNSLPTLRLSTESRASEFLTGPLLTEIRKDPLCRAAAI